jgi:hypothetical protein
MSKKAPKRNSWRTIPDLEHATPEEKDQFFRAVNERGAELYEQVCAMARKEGLYVEALFWSLCRQRPEIKTGYDWRDNHIKMITELWQKTSQTAQRRKKPEQYPGRADLVFALSHQGVRDLIIARRLDDEFPKKDGKKYTTNEVRRIRHSRGYARPKTELPHFKSLTLETYK